VQVGSSFALGGKKISFFFSFFAVLGFEVDLELARLWGEILRLAVLGGF
jgi:hypothetical protein